MTKLAAFDRFLDVTGATGRDLKEFRFRVGMAWILFPWFRAC